MQGSAVVKRKAVFLASAFLLSVLFSSFYIFYETEHECSGEDCEICLCLQMAEQNFSHLESGKAVSAVLAVFVLVYFCSVKLNPFFINTPVSKKIRLNN